MKTARLIIGFILAMAFCCKTEASVVQQTPNNEVELSAEEKEDSWEIKLHFRPKNGRHIYSHTPGDFGQPTEVFWQLDGAKLLEEEWSPGEDILFNGFGLNVYKHSGMYKAKLRKNALSRPRLTASWMACSDECVPESLSFELMPESFSGSMIIAEGRKEKPSVMAAPAPVSESGLFRILLLAFAGGVILNFMPCVFPILFIKVMSLGKAGSRRKNMRDAWLYMAGVLLCFFFIAALLWLLRASGSGIGWGFQLQSPYFLALMSGLFFVLGLMFLDVIKFNVTLKYIPAGAFLTGFLAVLIASPCTAPFMGAALGWVLTTERSPWTYYPVFLILGFGYALPFFLAGLYPQVLKKFLPRPGKWMDVLKKLFAIPMFITAFWLLWVLSGSGSNTALWKSYNAEEVERLAASGEKVLVNFTAKWCITCLVNEKNVFSDNRFAEMAKSNKIHLFKADWSSYNPKITEALAAYGRSSIPLYVYYGGNGGYVFLPQLLTSGIVENAILKDDSAAED